MRRLGWLLVALLAAVLIAGACTKRLPNAPDCSVMPADNYWHADVSALPVHPQSEAWVQSIGGEANLKPDLGSGLYQGGPIGIPYTTVGAGQPEVAMSFLYDDESDPGPYPIPPDAPIEGGPASTGDRHVIVVDRDACTLYEIFDAQPQPDGSWTGGSGAVFDLRSNDFRPDGWTSADAAGLPILPGLLRYEAVEANQIGHAIRVTAPQTQRAYIWPARHFASSDTDPDLPPMGAWFRLKADADLSGLSVHNRRIALALQKHGMILADNGSPWFISGVPDERWDNDDLRNLFRFTGADFEAVDASGLIVDPDSGQVNQ